MKFVSQFSRFKQQQASGVSSGNDLLVRKPCVREEILRVQFLKRKLLEVSFAVAEELENSLTNDAQLSVVLRVERNLKYTPRQEEPER